MALEREMSRNDEEEEEYDDEDDDDDDSEEEEILFDKRITFFSKEDDWKVNLSFLFFTTKIRSYYVMGLLSTCRCRICFYLVEPSF